jgi:hypothetical protein
MSESHGNVISTPSNPGKDVLGVAEARNKPNSCGMLMIVSGINLIVPGHLAWSD